MRKKKNAGAPLIMRAYASAAFPEDRLRSEQITVDVDRLICRPPQEDPDGVFSHRNLWFMSPQPAKSQNSLLDLHS